jgi:TrmH family RNA methyltransferase
MCNLHLSTKSSVKPKCKGTAQPMLHTLANVVVALHEPRNGANIGGVARAMKNFGLRQLRLVRPASFDPGVVEAMAHRSDDILAASTTHDDLDAALADAVFVVGTSGRTRELGPPPTTPRALAPALLRHAAYGPVVLLFGNEDNGLTNDDLARCHALVAIPTDPSYASLNLAQAVLLVAYELFLAAEQPQPPAPPSEPPANAGQLAHLAQLTAALLHQADFFKSQNAAPTLRRLRLLLGRASPSERDAALLLAMLRALKK